MQPGAFTFQSGFLQDLHGVELTCVRSGDLPHQKHLQTGGEFIQKDDDIQTLPPFGTGTDSPSQTNPDPELSGARTAAGRPSLTPPSHGG